MTERPLRIYLSGSIRKGSGDLRSPDHFWTEADEAFIRAHVGFPVELLNPAKTDIRRQDFALNFGCDLHLVAISDVVLVDARKEKGIGIGAEMMFAIQRHIPVIAWAPLDTHYRRSEVPDVFGENLTNWTHPFVFGLSDYVVDSLGEAVELIRTARPDAPLARHADPLAHIERFQRSLSDTRFVPIGGGVYQDMRGGGNEQEEIDGLVRFRFMDVLYLPAHTDEIEPEAVLAVNRWRERRISERPLLHCGRVRRIAGAALRSLGDAPRVFEIGCGKFPIEDEIKLSRWAGLDLDEEAVEQCRRRGRRMASAPNEVFGSDLEVDLVLSLFAMQFAMPEGTMHLLERLPPEAVVLLNLPTRDMDLVERRIEQLTAMGLAVRILDLAVSGVHDRLILAGREESVGRQARVADAALRKAREEWPSIATIIGWDEAKTSIAHRRNVR